MSVPSDRGRPRLSLFFLCLLPLPSFSPVLSFFSTLHLFIVFLYFSWNNESKKTDWVNSLKRKFKFCHLVCRSPWNMKTVLWYTIESHWEDVRSLCLGTENRPRRIPRYVFFFCRFKYLLTWAPTTGPKCREIVNFVFFLFPVRLRLILKGVYSVFTLLLTFFLFSDHSANETF